MKNKNHFFKTIFSLVLFLAAANLVLAQKKASDTENKTNTQETAVTKYILVDNVKYAYRSFGKENGIPLVLLPHFTATMDDWDPALVDPLAQDNHIILIDNKGIGGSQGVTPKTVEEMAADATKLINVLGYKKINLLGFSIGGFIAQDIARNNPDLVEKLILAGTGPKGGKNIAELQQHLEKAFKEEPDNPRLSLFFSTTVNGKAAGKAYAERLKTRRPDDKVPVTSQQATLNQAEAIIRYGSETDDNFNLIKSIKQPTLIVNGDNDKMIATSNSLDLVQNIPNSKLVIWSDAGHGALYQYHDDFVKQINEFLKDK